MFNQFQPEKISAKNSKPIKMKKNWKITSNKYTTNFKLSHLFSHHYLLRQLIYRDFVASYQQTLLGPAWFVIHPLITTAVFTVVFGRIIDMPTDGIPKPIFYLTGLAIWNYFSECTLRISSVFNENRDIFGKVYFPRILMPLTTAISMSVRLGIQIILIGIVLFWFDRMGYTVAPAPYSLILLLPIAFITALQATGIGLIMASITIRYRDLNFLIAFGLQMMMYSTTMLLPLTSVPEKFKILIQINPMTTVIETFRFALLGHGYFSTALLGYSVLISVLLFSIGLIAFNQVEKTFIDII